MGYTLFDICSVQVGGQPKRGARATCGHCGETGVTTVNYMRNSGDNDDDLYEKMVATKFGRLGWNIGRTPQRHRCPKCFTAIKISSVKKSNAMKQLPPENKVVSIITPEVTSSIVNSRTMTRDERRIIFEKINEIYVGEKVGYSDSWDDEKVAKDLGVPRAWVSAIREDMFGPDVNEATSALAAEMQELGTAVQQLVLKLADIERQFLNLRK